MRTIIVSTYVLLTICSCKYATEIPSVNTPVAEPIEVVVPSAASITSSKVGEIPLGLLAVKPSDSPHVRCTENSDCSERYCALDLGCDSDPECKKSCALNGGCTQTETKCAPSQNEHCENSKMCKDYGTCALVNGLCAATSDDHCLASGSCETDGYCSVTANGVCAAIKTDDCDKLCKLRGLCTPIDGSCQPLTCESECKKAGKCSMTERVLRNYQFLGTKFPVNRCMHTFESDCSDTEICRTEGRCNFGGSPSGHHHWRVENYQCQATTTGCKQADICKTDGKCFRSPFYTRRCITEDEFKVRMKRLKKVRKEHPHRFRNLEKED